MPAGVRLGCDSCTSGTRPVGYESTSPRAPRRSRPQWNHGRSRSPRSPSKGSRRGREHSPEGPRPLHVRGGPHARRNRGGVWSGEVDSHQDAARIKREVLTNDERSVEVIFRRVIQLNEALDRIFAGLMAADVMTDPGLITKYLDAYGALIRLTGVAVPTSRSGEVDEGYDPKDPGVLPMEAASEVTPEMVVQIDGAYGYA